MSRVFLTVLGTNDYLPCCYDSRDCKNPEPVRFVQESVIRRFCKGWNDNDRIVVFLTEKETGEGAPGSRERNWVDNGHEPGPDGTVNGTMGLRSTLEKVFTEEEYKGLQGKIRDVSIPWGKNEDEVWRIFQIVSGEIEHGDAVYFDVTHSFRSLPLLVFSVLLFSRNVKQATIEAVTYGAFEVLGPVGRIKSKIPDPRNRRAPLFDMAALFSIAQWSEAAMVFEKYGEAGPLLSLLDSHNEPLLKAGRGKDLSAQAVKKLSKRLRSFTEAIRGVRGRQIMSLNGLDWPVKNFTEHGPAQGPLAVVHELLDTVSRKGEGFQGHDLMNGLRAVKFCMDHGLVQQALTLLHETLISMVCRQQGIPWKNLINREVVSKAASICHIAEDRWDNSAKKNKELTRRCVRFFLENEEVEKVLLSLKRARNDMNHGGMLDNAEKYDALLKACEQAYPVVVEWGGNDLELWKDRE